MYSKVQIYNLALSALLLQRQIVDVTTDNSNEKVVLNQFYDIALRSTLVDLNLDSTSKTASLALIADPPAAPLDELWNYVYQYPTDCAFFRRVFSGHYKDNRTTHIAKTIEIYNGKKAIFTNEVTAVGQYLPHDVDLNVLNPMAGLALAQRLASLAAPLIVGKGAKKLREDIEIRYALYKAGAQEHDILENENYHAEAVESEFVLARMS